MPARRTTDEEKKARGTFTPARGREKEQLRALEAWPQPPRRFKSAAEKEAWERLGGYVLIAKTCTAADMPVAELCAEEMVRREEMRRDSDVKETARNAQAVVLKGLYLALGLSYHGRGKRAPAKAEETAVDELSEFDA